MSRVKIELPSTFDFSCIIPIRITDINYGNHVGNDAVLSLIHEARVQFLRQFDYGEMSFDGTSLIMSDAAIEFKSELFYGDRVKAYVTARDFSKVAFNIYYKLVREESETLVVVAKTGMVCYDYSKKRITAVPDPAREKLTIASSAASLK